MHRSLPPAAPGPPSDRPSDRLGDRLSTEWAALRRAPAALRRADAWGVVPGPVRDLDDVLAAAGYGLPSSAATENALRRLVATAAVDPLAGRVVLQRLLPALLARARRRGSASTGSGVAVALDELVGAAWIAIATYDLRRSPGCLAAALVADAEHRAFRAPARRRAAGEVPADVDFDAIAGRDADPDPLQELAVVFRLARVGGVAPDDLDLLRRLLAADRADDVAADLRVTSRTIRNRRARIAEQLRELAA